MATVLRAALSAMRLSLWTGLLISAGVAGIAYAVTARSIESDARQRFVNHARHAQGVVGVRIKSYTDLLRASTGMLQSTQEGGHRSFRAYVEGLQLAKNYPAVDTLSYAVHVEEADRARFERDLALRLASRPGDRYTPRIAPPGNRPAYLAVSDIEPGAQPPDRYGLDLLANPYLHDDLVRARDDGKLHASSRPIPVLSSPNDVHLGIRMPVYRQVAGLDTVARRRAAYLGSLGITFSLPKLMADVMAQMPLENVRVALYDTGPPMRADRGTATTPRVMFDSGVRPGAPPSLPVRDDTFSVALPFDFSGHPWRIVYGVPKAGLYTGSDLRYPTWMAACGFLGSILLYALVHTLTSSRRAALAQARDMTKELRESQEKLEMSHQKLRRLADHAYQVKELERKRIAREIDDDLGRSLLALRIEAQMLAKRSGARQGVMHKRTRATLKQIDAIIESTRQIIDDLRPTVLDLGLSAAVEWQARQFEHRTGIPCDVHDEFDLLELPDPCATAFFRILQESLAGIVRHATTTRVRVDLRLEDGWLTMTMTMTMTVPADGEGLHPAERNDSDAYGLVGMEERMTALGGTCSIAGESGEGMTIVVSAPVPGPPNHTLSHLQAHMAGSDVI